jgi:alkyl hydroperoxide reductase subunit AhpC
MKTIGDQFPLFNLTGVVSNKMDSAFVQTSHDAFPNKWLVIFSWPKDFTFVCPTEIAEFGRLYNEFSDRDAQILGFSTDSEFVHLAWRKQKAELKDLPFPMLADTKRELSSELGILNAEEGVANRATYIVDPQGIIRFLMLNDLNVGRNPKEVMRVLDGLQSDELCPCNWQKGEETLLATDHEI